MKTIQLEAGVDFGAGQPNDEIIRAGGVRRIRRGWYTVRYNGTALDCSTVVSARRNRKGAIK